MKTKTKKCLVRVAALLLAALGVAHADPIITRQPTNQSVSIGADVKFQVTATGSGLLSYQWGVDGTVLPNATNRLLVLTNVQPANAGGYSVVVSDTLGTASSQATSQVAHLEVDATFSKVTTGPVATDTGYSFTCAWVDYDNDGWQDLFVSNGYDPAYGALKKNVLYHNRGDGTFLRTTNAITTTAGFSIGAAWGDMDNDGRVDLFVANGDAQPLFLFRGSGSNDFTRITQGSVTTYNGAAHGGAWGDYDGDGLIDLFVVNFKRRDEPAVIPLPNVLFHNLGNGQFSPITFGTKTPNTGSSSGATWCDFDNDGDLDLFVVNGGWPGDQPNYLYRNDGNGSFTLLTNAVPALDGGHSASSAWGDYDNDGYPDLFIANITSVEGGNNFLYHNSGDGTFTRIRTGAIANDAADSFGCAWADYDNDGYLDLFVANGEGALQKNFLYHNNGDGTFIVINSGSLANDLGASAGCAWGDYDNDGFVDLFVSNYFGDNGQSPQHNFLYHNNGNSNAWLNVRLVGTVSNCSAIGAKVRVLATIGGKTMWQLREISGGSGFSSQNDMRANFGLGDATNIDLVRIEWPSGIVQTMTNVAVKQFLTVVEHQELGEVVAPSFASVSRSTDGAVDLSVIGDTGLRYLFEGSTNLVNWSWLGVRTNLTGSVEFTDLRATNSTTRFYRASVP